MMYGIGTDIADIRRFTLVYGRKGERFVRRILGPNEQLEWQRRSGRSAGDGVRFLATRFSAKEAFSKAIGLGMRRPMAWSQCEILNDAFGKPNIALNGDLKLWFDSKGLTVQLSISDETDYAVSFVVVERTAKPLSY